jgi:hypothetical protein
MFKKQARFVITKPDILAAVSHLNSLPYSNPLPKPWDQQHLINSIREALGQKTKVGDVIDIAPGVFGIIKPFGVDLSRFMEHEGRLQVWIAIRSVGTDPEHVTQL